MKKIILGKYLVTSCMIDRLLWRYLKRDLYCPRGYLRDILCLQLFFGLLFTFSDLLIPMFHFFGNLFSEKALHSFDLRNLFALRTNTNAGLSILFRLLTYSFVQKHLFYYVVFSWLLLRLGRPIAYVMREHHLLRLYIIGHLIGGLFFVLLTRVPADNAVSAEYKLENGLLPVLFTFLGAFASLAPKYAYLLSPFVLLPMHYILFFLTSFCMIMIFLGNQVLEKKFMMLYLINALVGYLYVKILKNRATGIALRTWLSDSYRKLKDRSVDAKKNIHSTILKEELSLQEALLLSDEEYDQLANYFKTASTSSEKSVQTIIINKPATDASSDANTSSIETDQQMIPDKPTEAPPASPPFMID